MTSLNDIRAGYIEDGIDYANASAHTAQEAVLDLIARDPPCPNTSPSKVAY